MQCKYGIFTFLIECINASRKLPLVVSIFPCAVFHCMGYEYIYLLEHPTYYILTEITLITVYKSDNQQYMEYKIFRLGDQMIWLLVPCLAISILVHNFIINLYYIIVDRSWTKVPYCLIIITVISDFIWLYCSIMFVIKQIILILTNFSNLSSVAFSTTFQSTVLSAEIWQGNFIPYNDFILSHNSLYTLWCLVVSFLSWRNYIKLLPVKYESLFGAWSLFSYTSSHSVTALSAEGSPSFVEYIAKGETN